MSTPATPKLTKDRMRADIARIMRMPEDEIGDDDDLADLGLDSMRAMDLVVKWSETGLDLEFGELAESLTLNSWWSIAERVMADRRNG